MSNVRVCCSKLATFPGAKSPFSKLVVLGYYDGPITGVLQCEVCGTAYRFELLDIDPDWDEGLDVKIFILSQLPPKSFEKLIEVCENCFGIPRWPVWVLIWNVGSEAKRNKTAKKIQEIEHRVANGQIIVATLDLSKEIIVAKEMDWFSLLGLSRRATKQQS